MTSESLPYMIYTEEEEIFLQFAAEAKHVCVLKKHCIIRRADDDQFEKAVLLWFIQERPKGTSISDVILMEKARLL